MKSSGAGELGVVICERSFVAEGGWFFGEATTGVEMSVTIARSRVMMCVFIGSGFYATRLVQYVNQNLFTSRFYFRFKNSICCIFYDRRKCNIWNLSKTA